MKKTMTIVIQTEQLEEFGEWAEYIEQRIQASVQKVIHDWIVEYGGDEFVGNVLEELVEGDMFPEECIKKFEGLGDVGVRTISVRIQ